MSSRTKHTLNTVGLKGHLAWDSGLSVPRSLTKRTGQILWPARIERLDACTVVVTDEVAGRLNIDTGTYDWLDAGKALQFMHP